MQEKSKFRQEEAVRLVNWLAENQDAWHRMCSSNTDYMSPQECIEYIEMMEEQEFYFMIPILLTINRHQAQIENALVRTAVRGIVRGFESADIHAVCHEIKNAIRKEYQAKADRMSQ